MCIVYQYDNKGFYAGHCDDCNGPLPHNCVRAAPPALPWERVWPHWNGAEWELAEDHRARRVADGFASALSQEPTDFWLPAPLPEGDDWQSPARAMRHIGPLPRGAVTRRPAKPAPTLKEAKASKLAAINKETGAAILDGFDFEIEGESLHFSYSAEDQQNFADMANFCLQRQAAPAAAPEPVSWKALRENGKQAWLSLSPAAFLDLYAAGALRHKNAALAQGARRKLALEDAQTLEAVEAV